MFQAQCPLCKGLYSAQDEWIGRQATCPHCHQIIVIHQTESGQQPNIPSADPASNGNPSNPSQQPYNGQTTGLMAYAPSQIFGMQPPERMIARVGTRFVALLLDNICRMILGLFFGVILGFILAIIFRDNSEFIQSHSMLFGYALGTIISWTYEGFFLSRYGATPGKMLFHLKVLHNGEYCSVGRAILRDIGRNISLIIICIGFIIAFFNKEHKTFHDMLCDTVVVEE